jgi:hypothetical protein
VQIAKWRLGPLVEIRHGLIHFLFGTLLNAFIVFYSAPPGDWAFLFLIGLGAVGRQRAPRWMLGSDALRPYSFALTSYLAYLFPTMAGQLDAKLFVAAVLISSGATLSLWWVARRFSHDQDWNARKGAVPGLAIQALLLALYIADAVPPVPLSLTGIAIAHNVEWQGPRVRIETESPPWKFWAHGDTEFKARPGDRVFVFAKVFAPKGFRDALKVRWEVKHPSRGWERSDLIPLTITGGERDWRGFAYKQNYRPGSWRVTIETDEGRPVGSIRFTITEDLSTEERVLRERWE